MNAVTQSSRDPAPYSHTQRGWIHVLMEIVAIVLLLIIWIPDIPFQVMLAITVGAAILFAGAMMFRTLTIQEEPDHLLVRFGPWPVFRRRIPWEKIEAAEAGKTAFIDGLGYHWIPFRGWTLNIAGRDCVRLRMVSGATIRLGTDDVSGLLAAVRRRIAPHKQRD